jgi:hypothetical protein
MIAKNLVAAAPLYAVLALAMHPAGAQTYVFKAVKFPKGEQAALAAINNGNIAVGGTFAAQGDVLNCFVLEGKAVTKLTDPNGAGGTECWGINNAGSVVGDYIDGNGMYNGFIDVNGIFTDINPPGSLHTIVNGVNDSNAVVGFYLDAAGKSHGFMFDGTTYKTLNIKGGKNTEAFGINDDGDYTIDTVLADGNEHSYLVSGKTKTEILFPNETQVFAHQINNVGQVAATTIDQNGLYHGGVYDSEADAYYIIDDPKATATLTYGINDAQTLAGSYQTKATGPSIAYVATGSLP